MSDNNECDPITPKLFEEIKQDITRQMVDNLCQNISSGSGGTDALTKAITTNLANVVAEILESDDEKEKLKSILFDSIRVSLHVSSNDNRLLYSLLDDANYSPFVELFIKELFVFVHKDDMDESTFSNNVIITLKNPPNVLFNTQTMGGKNKTRRRKNKTRRRKNKTRKKGYTYKKRTTRVIGKKQRGGGGPFDEYKEKLLSAMTKNMDETKNDIMERLKNAVDLYTRTHGENIIQAITQAIGGIVNSSGMNDTSKKIIISNALYSASEKVTTAISHTIKQIENISSQSKFNPNTEEFYQKFMDNLKKPSE